MRHLMFSISLFISSSIFAQISTIKTDQACINCPTDTPSNGAVLEVSATDKGILIPRVANTAAISSPIEGLLIYDSSQSNFKYYNGLTWIEFGGIDTNVEFGRGNSASNEETIAAGNFNVASGNWSNAFGNNNLTSGSFSSTLGYGNQATGINSSAIGYVNEALDLRSSAFGYINKATGESSSAFGSANDAGANSSSAFGRSNLATGSSSSAFGHSNITSASFSSAFGYSNNASAARSSAFGYSTISNVLGMMAVGVFNESPIGSSTQWISTDPVFAIGNGENFSARSTALTILKNGNTGIGTTTPNVLLDVAGDGQFSKIGTLAAPQLTLNQEAGDFARMRFTNNNSFTGGNDDFFAIQANVKPTSGGDGRFNISYQDNGVISNIFTVQVESSSREVGINKDIPNFNLDVSGTAGKIGGGVWSTSSDRRLKKDVEKFEDGLDQILKIRPVWYRYNGLYGMPTKEKYVGIIAQEMQKVAPYTITPYLATDEKTGNQKEFLSYNGTAVTYMLVNAIQEQQELIEAKEEQIEDLETRLARLEAILLQNKSSSTQKEQLSSARLVQNTPNPFNEKTNIQYFIPKETNTATLRITGANGRIIKEIPITATGEGQIELETSTLNIGNYFYSLLLDGQLFETKQMILSN
ncbi:MAG: tail fiber domain-containing protein [Bacteroidota bacterium]